MASESCEVRLEIQKKLEENSYRNDDSVTTVHMNAAL